MNARMPFQKYTTKYAEQHEAEDGMKNEVNILNLQLTVSNFNYEIRLDNLILNNGTFNAFFKLVRNL